MHKAAAIFIALVWLVFGLGFKVLNLVPRHTAIVAAVLGERIARPATLLVGIAEVFIAGWVLSGKRPRLCAGVQTAAILSMNTFEILYARELLLSWPLMLTANALFISLIWWWALDPSAHEKSA